MIYVEEEFVSKMFIVFYKLHQSVFWISTYYMEKIYEVDTNTNFKHIFNKDLFTLNKKLELPCCKFHLDLYQKYYLQM